MADQTQPQLPAPPAITALELAERADPETAKTYAFAKLVTGSAFLSDCIRDDPRAVFLMLMTGREMGLNTTHALRSLYVTPQGKIGIQGDVALALLLSKGFRVIWTASNATVASVVIVRPSCKCANFKQLLPGQSCDCGGALAESFTREEADAAGITKSRDGIKDNWRHYPKDMLRWRALLRTARQIAADILGGVYTEDEIEEITTHETAEPRTLESVERQAGVDQPQVEDSKVPAELESKFRAVAHNAGRTQGWVVAVLAQAQEQEDPKAYIETQIADITPVKAPKKRGKPDPIVMPAPAPMDPAHNANADRLAALQVPSSQGDFPDLLG